MVCLPFDASPEGATRAPTKAVSPNSSVSMEVAGGATLGSGRRKETALPVTNGKKQEGKEDEE